MAQKKTIQTDTYYNNNISKKYREKEEGKNK